MYVVSMCVCAFGLYNIQVSVYAHVFHCGNVPLFLWACVCVRICVCLFGLGKKREREEKGKRNKEESGWIMFLGEKKKTRGPSVF